MVGELTMDTNLIVLSVLLVGGWGLLYALAQWTVKQTDMTLLEQKRRAWKK